MSALDFPSSPAVGQLFQQSDGQPSYLWDGTVWKLMAQPKGIPAAGFRNVLMNGDIGIWRRNFPNGGAATTGSPYMADRWQWSSVNTTVTINAWPQTSPGAIIGCEAPRVLQMAVNSVAGAGNYGLFLQKIEYVNSLVSNEPYTLSFWANSGGQSLKIGIDIQRYYGSGGSPSAQEVLYRGQVVTTASVWKKYAVTFTASSMAGKTLGSNADDYAFVQFWLDAGSTYAANSSNIGQQTGTWQFTNIQLERGAVATPFERRPLQVERQLCQRYYESGIYYSMFSSPSSGGFAKTECIEFLTTKRVTPSMVRAWSSYGNVASFNANGTTQANHHELVTSSALGNAYGTFQWEASAEL